MSTSTLASMTWRRALKHFAPSTPIDITPILKAAALAPSSFGIQPFQIYVVTSPEMKSKIAPVAYNQPQITECSHLLVFAARKDAKVSVERCIKAHNFDVLAPEYATIIRNSLGGLDDKSFLEFACNQTHVALGFSLVAAADLKIGSCPMGGFNAEGLGAVLNLPPNEQVTVLMAVGITPTGEAEGKANPFPKYRMTLDDIVTHL